MQKYILAWLAISITLAFEYYALNFAPRFSMLLTLQRLGYIASEIKISTAPGRSLSLWLGWIGFGLMALMNLYSIRKRSTFMQGWGRLSSWMNFHVFCGILGPTLILFHCGLKVRGLVGISFWSMVISFLSGIVGRYFFIQLSAKRSDLERRAQDCLDKLDRVLKKFKVEVVAEEKARVVGNALAFAGVTTDEDANPIFVLGQSMLGDLRIAFRDLPLPSRWPRGAEFVLVDHALYKRRIYFFESFESLMGFWHAFHFPFAVFMYLAAIVHIASSLIFLGGG